VTHPFGVVLKQARQILRLSAVEVSRAAGISTAYLSKLESDSVKKPSPQILQQLSEALSIPYADLMRLNGYLVPGDSIGSGSSGVPSALFGDLSDDERDELFEYLTWYRARRRMLSRRSRGVLPA
jgi:transcriptional regulator with XRE-family HTH domain